VAIEAAAIAAKRHPDLLLTIVGSTWVSKYEDYCRSLISKFGIEGNVLFWGPASRDVMPHIYSSAMLSLIPSVHAEGTSLSALEGMACGVPTVASEVGGLLDIPCIHFPAGNATALADWMSCLLEDDDRRKQIGERQQCAVREQFNLDVWKLGWERVVRKCLSQ